MPTCIGLDYVRMIAEDESNTTMAVLRDLKAEVELEQLRLRAASFHMYLSNMTRVLG